MSRNSDRTIETHCYTLWRDVAERDDGTFITDDILISMDKHGAMHSNPVHDRGENIEGLSPQNRLSNVVQHNIAEIHRAMKEGGKWETRLKDSPLGKTQQDFVAYYRDVIGLFTEWCNANTIPLRH